MEFAWRLFSSSSVPLLPLCATLSRINHSCMESLAGPRQDQEMEKMGVATVAVLAYLKLSLDLWRKFDCGECKACFRML